MIRAAGYEPEVVDYMKTGWTRPLLVELLGAMKASPRAILREKEPLVAELGLGGSQINDEILIAAMIKHPVLVNRPIVVTPKGTKLCRPSEEVLSLLERQPDSFTKEDGEVVKPAR
jgi:arsenate reductase (glutaredoxin)